MSNKEFIKELWAYKWHGIAGAVVVIVGLKVLWQVIAYIGG